MPQQHSTLSWYILHLIFIPKLSIASTLNQGSLHVQQVETITDYHSRSNVDINQLQEAQGLRAFSATSRNLAFVTGIFDKNQFTISSWVSFGGMFYCWYHIVLCIVALVIHFKSMRTSPVFIHSAQIWFCSSEYLVFSPCILGVFSLFVWERDSGIFLEVALTVK